MPLVQVTLVRGRTVEQKHALIASVSQAVAQSLGTPIERVRVAIYEVGGDEWGIGGQPYSVARAAPAAASPEPASPEPASPELVSPEPASPAPVGPGR
jgi:4-oxalocrotonate tautomerase